MKIALFTVGFGGGGAEKVFVELANHWRQLGHEVIFWVIRSNGPLRERLSPEIPVHALGVGFRFLQKLSLTKKLLSQIKESKPNVLFSTLTYANCLASAASRHQKTNVKVILREANSFENLRKHGFLRYCSYLIWMKRSYPWADGIIVNAENVKNDIESKVVFGKTRVTNIPNPIHLDSNFEVNNKLANSRLPKIIACGRLIQQKGFFDLLEAFSILLKNLDAELTILGDGPLRKDILEKAENLGICSKFKLPGFVQNVREYYYDSDLFVLSSHWEGFPNALVEAMACGLPVVSTDCPGASRDIMSPDFVDYLANVQDPQDLANKMEQALRFKPEASSIRAVIENRFSFKKIADAYIKFASSEAI